MGSEESAAINNKPKRAITIAYSFLPPFFMRSRNNSAAPTTDTAKQVTNNQE